MSRNNKNATRHQIARDISASRKAGNKGPSKTTPVHGKRNAWFQKFRTYHDYFVSLTSKGRKTAKQEIPATPSAV